jgi:beta-lactamase regulating signal transducer with metallopeptidase domain
MTTLLNQPWTERLGWTLLHFLWQGTLVAALYGLGRAWAGGRISANGRYLLACASLLAMAAAPAVTYWSLGNSSPMARIGSSADLTVTEIASRITYTPDIDPWQPAMPGIVLAWFAGATACSVRLLMGFLSAAALKRSCHVPVLPEWQQALDRLIDRMQVSRRVQLLATDRVDSPSVIGWIRPVILAPVSMLSGLPSDQVEALLAHELAHIRRHDYLVNILQGIAESLLFYHPAVWWISSQIRTEREHCCDDLAVAASGDVLVYARALAELESMRPARFKAALSANDGSLLHRIRRLATPGQVAHTPAAAWGVAGSLGSLLLLAIAGIAVTGAQAQSQPPVVKLASVWTDTVAHGDLKLEVRGLGTVTSANTATLKVAETQMKDVQQGATALVDLRNHKEIVAGKVSMVHPEVVSGTVTVDLILKQALPPYVHVQQSIDGTITIGSLKNVLYVGRPVLGKSNSRVMLFKLDPDGHSAKRVPVQFGAASVQRIEVKSGLQPGDKIIISDMAQYDGADAIVLR